MCKKPSRNRGFFAVNSLQEQDWTNLSNPAKLIVMKNQSRAWIIASLLAGGLLSPVLCLASPALPVSFNQGPAVRQGQPLQTTNTMPWFILPGRFLFSGGYYVKLSIQEMRIDHMTDDTRCTRKNRTFMISASFAQPVGELFSSRFELPLFSADSFSVSRLVPASVGDYVMHLSNAPLYNSAAQLMVTAKF